MGGQIWISKVFAQLGVEKLIKFGAEFRWADKTIIGSVNARRKKGLLLVVMKFKIWVEKQPSRQSFRDDGQKCSKHHASLENRQTVYSFGGWVRYV